MSIVVTPAQKQAAAIFTAHGLTAAGAAAIVGNGVQESGPNLDPTINRVHADHGSGGFMEWRLDRKDALIAFGGAHAGELATQCLFVLHELETDYPRLNQQLRDPSRSVANLTANFCWVYERPSKKYANLWGTADRPGRAEFAAAVLADLQALPTPKSTLAPTGALVMASVSTLVQYGPDLVFVVLALSAVVLSTVHAIRMAFDKPNAPNLATSISTYRDASAAFAKAKAALTADVMSAQSLLMQT